MGVEQYRELFVTETEEHVQAINTAILSLEKNPNNLEVLNTIFRSAHTLKGMSATMGYEAITRLTHKMEDLLDIFRKQKVSVTSEVVDILFKCLDMLEVLVEEIKTNKKANVDVEAMVVQLENVIPTISSIQGENTLKEKTELGLTRLEKENLAKTIKECDFKIYKINIYFTDDCRLRSTRAYMVFAKLAQMGEVVKAYPPSEDLELNKVGKMFSLLFITKSAKKKFEEAIKNILELEKVESKLIDKVEEIPEEQESIEKIIQGTQPVKIGESQAKDFLQLGVKKIQSIRISTKRIDKLMNVVGELVIAKIRLMQLVQVHRIQQLSEILTNIDRLTGDLQNEVMQARLIPIAQVFDRFPRMVRDLARSEGKQVNLNMSGGEIELDRTVLDEIADPLVHLLRNCVDHGIEFPQERKDEGKNSVGTIKLSAVRERTFVRIEVSDDGRGINPNTIRDVALRKGVIEEEELEKLKDKDVLNLILLPGFSTAAKVTSTSGRGVGMDVVKMKMEMLGGCLEFDSIVGKGSIFKLKLPLTVAIIRAMLVDVHSEIYATPIANIAETVKISEEKIKRVEKTEVINLRGEVLPLIRLEKILGITNAKADEKDDKVHEKDISIVIVEMGRKKAGLVVDKFLGQQEVVIKSIGAMLKGIKGFAGATILGDGKVALILDVGTLVG